MAVHCMLMHRKDAKIRVSRGRTTDYSQQQSGSSREAMSMDRQQRSTAFDRCAL